MGVHIKKRVYPNIKGRVEETGRSKNGQDFVDRVEDQGGITDNGRSQHPLMCSDSSPCLLDHPGHE